MSGWSRLRWRTHDPQHDRECAACGEPVAPDQRYCDDCETPEQREQREQRATEARVNRGGW